MKTRVLGAALAIATTLGCASASLTVTKPLATPLSSVSLAIEPRGASMSGEEQSRLRTAITSSLAKSGVEVQQLAAGTSALNGQIDRYQPGSRALRYFIGFGAGKGALDSSWSVLDESGVEVGTCRVRGSVVMGVFGGSYDAVLEKTGKRLGEFLTGKK